MLNLTCTVRGLMNTPASINGSTGEVRPAKIQVQVETEAPNGQIEMRRIKIKPEDAHLWTDAKSETVSVPVNVWCQGGQWGFWLPEGSKPVVVDLAL